jgi:hypothetical protein
LTLRARGEPASPRAFPAPTLGDVPESAVSGRPTGPKSCAIDRMLQPGGRRGINRGPPQHGLGPGDCSRAVIRLQETAVLKILAWIVAIIFIIGLLTVTGVLKLVF